MLPARIREEHFQSYLLISFDIITTMILQNTNFRLNHFWIESFDSLVCYFWEPQKKTVYCRSKEQRSHLNFFFFQIGFDIIATMILANTISKFNLFFINSFDSWVFYCDEPQKICWMLLQKGTKKSIFKVISWIGINIITNDTSKYFSLNRVEYF